MGDPLDPALKLAITMHESPGVYALLLGSGVSRGSGIPTGWEITQDLIRRLAQVSGADMSGDPEGWYRKSFGEDPDYSSILERLSQSPAERCALLRSYFEPTAEQRAAGEKMPTRAHRAIAELMRRGTVRVVLTTNFDRLLEQALEAIGVVPDVISSQSAVKGAPPLVHSPATIIKIHGDYRDTRIKNTVSELSRYDPTLDTLIDRVLDEYGLLASGWSAEWDIALRDAIKRCPTRRYGTYWTGISEPKTDAADLIGNRHGEFIKIANADQFFDELAGRIQSLDDIEARPAISTKLAVATVKRYMADPASRIRLHELFTRELHACVQAVPAETFRPNGDSTEWLRRLKVYEAASATPRAIAVPLTAWGTTEQQALCAKAIITLGKNRKLEGGYTEFLNLRRYPAMLVLYCAGLTATATGAFGVLLRLFGEAMIDDAELDVGAGPAGIVLRPQHVLSDDQLRRAPGQQDRRTPASDHLHDLLRDDLRELIPDDAEYSETFDLFEYIWSLRLHFTDGDPFLGRFAWRRSSRERINKEVSREAGNWAPFREHLFCVEYKDFQEKRAALEREAESLSWR